MVAVKRSFTPEKMEQNMENLQIKLLISKEVTGEIERNLNSKKGPGEIIKNCIEKP